MENRKYHGIPVMYLVLLVIVPSTFAVSCENMVRLADLQDIIKNQTKLIQQQGQVIEEQRKVMKSLAIGKRKYLYC